MLRTRYIVGALLLHVALFSLLMVGAFFTPSPVVPPVIEAVLITSGPPKAPPKQPEPTPVKEEAPTPLKEKPKPPKEEPPKPDPKIEEQKRVEQEQKLEKQAEIKRQADLVKKQMEDEKKLKKLEEQERKNQMESEAKTMAEEQRQRELEAARLRQQSLNDMLDKEKAGRQATEREKWMLMIQEKIQRNWVRPINSVDKFTCNLRVQQLPGGTVIDVKLTSGCGSPALDESVKRAVLKSDPLPMPSDPSIFDRNLNLNFVPKTN